MRAATLVLVSSKVTVAVLASRETSTWVTPSTRARLFFTTGAHEAQYILSTLSVTVFSPATTGHTDRMATKAANAEADILIGVSSLSYKEGYNVGERKRDGNQHRRNPKPGLGNAIRDGPSAVAFRARDLGFTIDHPKPPGEKRERQHHKEGLIRCQGGQVADPGAAHPKGEQHQRENTAGGGDQCSGDASYRVANIFLATPYRPLLHGALCLP